MKYVIREERGLRSEKRGFHERIITFFERSLNEKIVQNGNEIIFDTVQCICG